ncbi:hypothetical protein QAD02_019719 [Eretmocerus hayati]|uniref:Uncharacterized protein n=1 Tax=Eretmocerus hayati TaxID=131215 RepID=A0ACC2PKD5_9HYME|nr:hypothetical protein QAD02_019719 [Eretmocerus hayati]
MCRFCACELSKSELSKKCSYEKNNIVREVEWNSNNSIDYHPSSSLQPKDSGLPVIIDGKHLQSSEDRLFCPMYWSLIPPWHKGALEEWGATTHNARLENLSESKIYSSSLREGKRCVVVMEGFYEFKKTGSQPAEVYYLHSMDNELLKAAGLFSTLKRENGETLYTCTVITNQSEGAVSQVHHRMPFLLNDNTDIQAWLDYKNVSSSDALTKLKSTQQLNLKFYKTAKIGSKDPMTAKKVLASKSMMSNWLKSGTKRKAED